MFSTESGLLTSSSTYITGLCSTGATLATCLQDARESQCLLPDDDSLKLFIESGPDKDQIWIRSSFDTSRLKVPQQDLAMECIEGWEKSLVYNPMQS